MPADGVIELTFHPSLELVSIVRRFVDAFFGCVVGARDVSSRVALATHELLENAAKYSSTGATTVRVHCDAAKRRVVVRMTNPTTPEHVARLGSLFAEMRTYSDADAFYLALITRTVDDPTGSGLGLGRIAAEAEMTLGCEVVGGDVVVTAVAQMERA